jgi:nucleoside-diphosphate-sugar epimerase
MRVVVTGATGNVGTALVRALGRDDDVDAIVGVARRRPAWSAPKVAWEPADVARDELDAILRGADAVVHLAWLIQPSRDERVTRAVNVDGSARVFDAAARAGVGTIVYASSVGTYAPGPKDRAVDESWPATGVPSSFYSRHKAEVERRLDAFEGAHPEMRVARLRPGFIFQRDAAAGVRRLFAGPLLPGALVRHVPIVPRHPRLRFQAVHADDVAQAYRLALRSDARGAFNVAPEPVLDGDELARALGARAVDVPGPLLRAGADLTWRLRLQPTPAGWVDLALAVPIMDTTRAREQLGWSPRRSAVDAFLDLVGGLADGAGGPTPPLHPRAGGVGRVRELLTGVGGRS